MSRRLRIMVADDEEVILEACQRILRQAGYEVSTAINGLAALGLLRDNDFDLVVLDIKMPLMDGMQLMEVISREKPGLPVVVITGYDTAETSDEALKAGASDFLAKPFSPKELRRTIEGVLNPALGDPKLGKG